MAKNRKAELSIEDEIKGIMAAGSDSEDAAEPVEETAAVDPAEAETTEAVAPEEAEAPAVIEEPTTEPAKPVVEVEPAPASLSPSIKAKWSNIDPELRKEIARREEEVHKGFTKHDEERNFGKQLKEVISPYMPIIQAEGGTPEGAVRDLLNTAYVLRTGSAMQKAQLLQQVAAQYGVDMRLATTPQQEVNPHMQHLQSEVERLRQMANPEVIKNQLREEMEYTTIQKEVAAFSANPKNVHFEQVKAAMAPLLSSGQAKDLQEAYDMACWSRPEIRSSLLAAQRAEEEGKRKKEMAAKKQAAASVSGSPSSASPSARASNKSIEDELRANLEASRGTV